MLVCQYEVILQEVGVVQKFILSVVYCIKGKIMKIIWGYGCGLGCVQIYI